jgi:hypothetical protein
MFRVSPMNHGIKTTSSPAAVLPCAGYAARCPGRVPRRPRREGGRPRREGSRPPRVPRRPPRVPSPPHSRSWTAVHKGGDRQERPWPQRPVFHHVARAAVTLYLVEYPFPAFVCGPLRALCAALLEHGPLFLVISFLCGVAPPSRPNATGFFFSHL